MAKKPIDELGRTTLPWAEYRVKAGKIWNSIEPGKPKKKIVEEALGRGYWKNKEGEWVEWILKSNKDRIENFQRQPLSTRESNSNAFTKKRKTDLAETNKLASKEDLAAGKVKQKDIQSVPGRNADHITEVQTFGPATEQLNKEWKAGAIGEEEYLRRKKILSDTGDTAQNFQDLSVIENQNKKDIVEAKNKALKNMEELNPSTRHLDEKYVKAMGLANDYKVSKFAKAIRAIKPVGKFIPVIGAGIVGLDVKARTQEAIENPTWQNKTQALLGGVEAGLEGFELATGGVGGLITTPLQIGLMIADQLIHQTEDEWKNRPRMVGSRSRFGKTK